MLRLLAKNAAGLPALRSVQNVRLLSQTNRLMEKETPSQQTPAAAAPSPAEVHQIGQKKAAPRKLTTFDKKVLIWTGKYKNEEEIPPNVAPETIDRSRDKFRVKSCIWMMVACTVACIVQVIRGKRAAQRGESVVNDNLEWHRKYNETGKK